jgi:hypothetical protein
MKHQNIDQLGAIAEIVPFEPQEKLTRRQRLERWADILDRNPGKLNALTRIEYMKPTERPQARVDNSPLEVAFKDPMLREDGLTGDRLGDAMAFFELSDRQAHRLFCDCHYSGSMTGAGLAMRLRRIAQGGWRAWFA